MKSPAYILSIPVSNDQWITVLSNAKMEAKHFDTLDRFLALQREFLTEDDVADAQAIDARSGETAKTGSIGEADESAVRQDAPMIPGTSGGAA